jgi:hypothetical protein
MTKWTAMQVLSKQYRLFKNMNVVVGRRFVQISAMFSRLLQIDVMHNPY